MATAECLWIKTEESGGGILCRVRVAADKTERGYAVCVNGVYVLTALCGILQDFSFIVPASAAVNEIYLEDIGDVQAPEPGDIPAIETNARASEAATADRLRIQWDSAPSYGMTAVQGDDQLSSIVVTGARRNVNVQSRPARPTRCRLYYSIERIRVRFAVTYLVNDDDNHILADGESVTVR
jgi:hypothetical protein